MLTRAPIAVLLFLFVYFKPSANTCSRATNVQVAFHAFFEPLTNCSTCCLHLLIIFVTHFRPRTLTQMALLGAVAEFVALDQQPFNVVDAPSLRNLIRVAANDASITVPSRPTVSERVWKMAISAEGKLREMLKGTRPALTTDGWTSNSGVSRGGWSRPLICCR